MKKLLITSVLAFLGIVSVNAQRVQKGEAQLNAGIAFNSAWSLPVYVGVDYGVHKDITVGADVGFATDKNVASTEGVEGTWFRVGARGDYHFNSLLKIPNKWDVYSGVILSYDSFSYKYTDKAIDFSAKTSGIHLGLQIGGRYYFTKNIAINAEFGGAGIVGSTGRVGVSYKF